MYSSNSSEAHKLQSSFESVDLSRSFWLSRFRSTSESLGSSESMDLGCRIQDSENEVPVVDLLDSTMDQVDEGVSVEKDVPAGEDQGDEDAADEMEIDPVSGKRKRRKTSWVWKELKEIKDADGNEKVVCLHCKAHMKAYGGGNTSTYIRHLKRCIKRNCNLKQQNIMLQPSTEGSQSVTGIQSWKYDEAKLRQVLSHMIMVHELPFSFVEYELFNFLMRTVTPQWKKISRITARKDCFASYENEKKRIKALLESVNRIGITTDLWKSGQKVQYMVVTAHFVDSDWKLQKRVINFVDLPPPHTGLAVSDALFKCFEQWGKLV